MENVPMRKSRALTATMQKLIRQREDWKSDELSLNTEMEDLRPSEQGVQVVPIIDVRIKPWARQWRMYPPKIAARRFLQR
jgi:hypothetical protein